MHVRGRFFIEVVLALTFGLMLFVTLLRHDWIERVFGARPDHGNGSVEWQVLAGLMLVTVTCSALARMEWRRTRAAC